MKIQYTSYLNLSISNKENKFHFFIFDNGGDCLRFAIEEFFYACITEIKKRYYSQFTYATEIPYLLTKYFTASKSLLLFQKFEQQIFE